MSENFENVTSEIAVAENNVSASQTTASSSSTIDSSILAQFAFYEKKKGEKRIPVYPYVVALTGHRDAELTDDVKKMATQQLRALSKAWDAKSGRTAPLIALVGISGNSELFWIDTAIKLRDEENLNINVVAVTSVPYKYLNLFSQQEYNALNARIPKSENVEKGKVDAVIECPLESKFVQKFFDLFIKKSEQLTGQESTQREKDNIFVEMMSTSKKSVFRYYQIDEYVKFMSLHSHTLIALSDSNDNWKTANWLNFNIDTLQPSYSPEDSNNKNNSPNSSAQNISPETEPTSIIQWVWELKNKLFTLFESKDTTSTITEIINDNFVLKDKEVPKFARTDYMILYKLLGRIGSRNLMFKLNENNDGFEDKSADLTFASIGPVVCITPPKNTKTKPTVSVLVKDRPFDEDLKIVRSENWSGWFGGFKSIAKFPEIKQVLEKLGMVNHQLVKKTLHWKTPENNESFENAKEFFQEKDKDKVGHLLALYDKDQDSMNSLIKHYNYADKLAKQYERKTEWRTLLYCVLCFVALCLCYPCEKMHDWIVQPDNQFTFRDTLINGLAHFKNPFQNLEHTCFHVSAIIIGISIIVVTVIYWWSWLKKYHLYYHYFKMIAEGLRIQIFWRLAGMSDAIAGNFKSHQTREFAWLRTAFIGLDVTLDDDKPKHKSPEQLKSIYLQLIKPKWLGIQLQDIVAEQETCTEKLLKWKDWLPIKIVCKLIIWCALIYILGNCFKHEFWNLPSLKNIDSTNPQSWVIILMFIICFGCAIFGHFKLSRTLTLYEIDRRHTNELLFPYRRAYILLGRNMELWEMFDGKTKDLKQLSKENQEILRQIGQIVLGKKSDWHLLINDRDLTLPR